MADSAAPTEQLRRLKNTVMGAGHRLSLLAQSGEFDSEAANEVAAISRDLTDAVGRLERLLATLRHDR